MEIEYIHITQKLNENKIERKVTREDNEEGKFMRLERELCCLAREFKKDYDEILDLF